MTSRRSMSSARRTKSSRPRPRSRSQPGSTLRRRKSPAAMPRSSSMRSKSLRSSKRQRSRSDDTAPGAFAPGARTLAQRNAGRIGQRCRKPANAAEAPAKSWRKPSVAAPHRSPTRKFYAKHPEDDMTKLNIASQDAATLETAPTCYIEGHGIRFAYRRLGPATGTPLVLLQHFSGNIDAWDPAVVNALATDRPVIAFDNAGVGRSTGQTPDNIAEMARDAVAFINLLGLSEVDLLGFSLGGCVTQQIAAEHERLVRKLILVGTAPKGGEEHLLAVLQQAFSQTDAPDPRLPLFFTNSSASRSSGLAFLKRTKVRKDDRDTDNGSAVTDPQAKALITWCATPDPGHAILRAIRQPALVVSGSHDTMLPANNAYAMFKELSNAQLVLYPDSGHGALFQHHEMFVSHVRTFLDAQPAAA